MTGLLSAGSVSVTAAEPAVGSQRLLVIGYGNPGRQDDGLGPAAVAEIEKLGWPNVSTMDDYQLVIEDAIEVAAHDVILFVDATREGDEPCTIRRLAPALDIAFTSHLLKPEALLAITAQQFGRCPEAYLVGIRGYDFDFLEGLSEQARGNLATAVALLRRQIDHFSRALR